MFIFLFQGPKPTAPFPPLPPLLPVSEWFHPAARGSTHGGGDDPLFFFFSGEDYTHGPPPRGGLHGPFSSEVGRGGPQVAIRGPEESQKRARGPSHRGGGPNLCDVKPSTDPDFSQKDRSAPSSAMRKLNIAMFQACPVGLFLLRYFSNQIIT